MKVIVDLHAHSAYSGGVGTIKLDIIDKTVPYKGIHLVGTGDVQFPVWNKELKGKLEVFSDGIYQLKGGSKTKFLLQTEIIITCKIGSKSKLSHCVVLFKNFDTVDRFYSLLEKWDSKVETMGRPFLVCNGGSSEVSNRVQKILDLEEDTELIPAHVLTPDGVYGSGVRINCLTDYFGEATERIHAVETGLSADPKLLFLIPELDDKTLISNSDAHSVALHRIGREFTQLEIPGNRYSYHDIIKAIRNDEVSLTAEFNITEGRYFLTGHRGGRNKHLKKKNRAGRKSWHENDEFCCFSPNFVPAGDICPICGSKLKVGAFQRAVELGKVQGEERNWKDYKEIRKAVHVIPLAEIIAYTFGKGVTTKFVTKEYMKIVKKTGTECDIWTEPLSSIKKTLANTVDEQLLINIEEVRKGNFCFSPPGFDGLYGELIIGRQEDVENINKIVRQAPAQKKLLDYIK
ncbi:MAG: endonuclease Q family protein [Candidatus Odinarchaeota archaeon]